MKIYNRFIQLHWHWFVIFLFLVSCTPPIYQHTTYDIEEFMADSHQIAQGKFAIRALEEQETDACLSEYLQHCEEITMDGDELNIVLYCPQRRNRMYALDRINSKTSFRVCNGKIWLPELSSVEVEGLTLNEVRAKVQAAYNEQLRDIQVFVDFKKRHERQVQIIGAERTTVIVDGRMRLSEVLAIAVIPPTANLFQSYVMRDGQQLPIDLYKLIHEGDESQNIVMRGNDQIFIASANDATVMVTGEVPHPAVIPVHYGFISLREALVMAGGIPFTGNKCCIQIIRGNLVRPKIYCLVWRDITHVPNSSLLLMPGDVVVISEKPITQWNRFINQLQPSTQGMQGAFSIYQMIKAATE